MYKVFCDICGKDITNYAGSMATGKHGRLTVEIMIAIDGMWNGGHACEACISAACDNAGIPRKNKEVAHASHKPE